MLEKKEIYKCLGNLGADTIKQVKIKEKVKKKEYLRRTRSLFERNLTKGINTWAVSLVR